MHQGSTLSPLLFVIVVEAIPMEFRVALPWELLYADDLAVIAETEGKKVKFSHTRYRALGRELIPVYRQSARR